MNNKKGMQNLVEKKVNNERMKELISVTNLSTYLFCKRKLYLENVLGLKALPPEANIKGTIRHAVLDLVSKQEKGIVLSITKETVETIPDKYRFFYSKNLINAIKINTPLLEQHKLQAIDVYNELWPWFAEDAELRARYLSETIARTGLFGSELWEALTPRIITELFVASDELELKGKIDRVEQHKEVLVPVEIKTGRAPSEGVWESHLVQVGSYMLLLEYTQNATVNEGKIYYLDSGERVVKMNPALREEIVRLKDKVKIVLHSQDIPDFVDNENKCRKCPLQKDCWELGGRKL